MVPVAQLVRAPVCGTGGRGFKSHQAPHYYQSDKNHGLFVANRIAKYSLSYYTYMHNVREASMDTILQFLAAAFLVFVVLLEGPTSHNS